MLDIRWTFPPYKEGRPATDLLAYLKFAFIWSREAFLLFEQEKGLYNGFNSVSSVSTVSTRYDFNRVYREMHGNRSYIYIASARYESRLFYWVHKAINKHSI
jgi:hypothetical protein